MKHALIAVFTLLLVMLFANGAVSYVERSVMHTADLVEQAKNAVHTEDAKNMIEQAEQYWKSHEKIFGALLQHNEIDDVIDTFALLKAYAVRGDWDDYYGNCASLLARLEHISAKEQPLLQNIM